MVVEASPKISLGMCSRPPRLPAHAAICDGSIAAAVSPCGRLTLQGPAVENGATLSGERVVLLGKCFVA